jgi:hypothetical protein
VTPAQKLLAARQATERMHAPNVGFGEKSMSEETPRKGSRPNHGEDEMEKTMPQKRIFFVAEAGRAWNTCICEMLAGDSHGPIKYRYIPWSKLTRAEWRRGKELVKQLVTPVAPLPDGSYPMTACPTAYRPKNEDVAKALEEFVIAVERSHGAEIWRG